MPDRMTAADVVLPWAKRRPQRRISGGREIRHQVAPLPMSCRWCGFPKDVHMQWIRGRSWHSWEQPTRAQIEARLRVRLARMRQDREERRWRAQAALFDEGGLFGA